VNLCVEALVDLDRKLSITDLHALLTYREEIATAGIEAMVICASRKRAGTSEPLYADFTKVDDFGRTKPSPERRTGEPALRGSH